MKKNLLLLCFIVFFTGIKSQHPRPGDINIPMHLQIQPAGLFHPVPINGSSRSSNYSFLIDYGALDNAYASNAGLPLYYYRYQPLNSRYRQADLNTLSASLSLFDTLINFDGANAFYYPKASSTVMLDSFQVVFIHSKATLNTDSIRFTVFDSQTFSVTGFDSSGSFNFTPVWDTLIQTNAALPPNLYISGDSMVSLTFYPGLSFPQGHSFGISQQFSGDTADKYFPVASCRDECASLCGAEQSIVGDNSFFFYNYADSVNNYSGINIGFDCNGDSLTHTPGACEYFFYQDNWIYPFVTVTADTMIPFNLTQGMISGRLYIDVNQNSTFQSGTDYPIRSTPVSINTISVTTSTDGTYQKLMNDGLYTVSAPSINNFSNSSPSSVQLTLAGGTGIADFAYAPLTTVDSLVLSSAMSTSLCFGEVPIWLSLLNAGTTIAHVKIVLQTDTLVEAYYAYPPAINLMPHEITWEIDSLFPLSQLDLQAHMLMPSFMNMGDSIFYRVTIQKDSAGNWVDALNDTMRDVIVCSFDPNDKKAVPAGESYGSQTLLNTPIEYTVRFQNTGTAPAAQVVIRDTLDTYFDLSTFQFISSSHPSITTREGRYVEFNFKNINLPDSNANEPGSHGYVKYKISPIANLISGTEVENTAHIYFDFNPAVTTNTAVTEYVTQFTTGICNCDDRNASLIIAPNPFHDYAQVFFTNPDSKPYVVELYDLQGRRIKQFDAHSETCRIFKDGISRGMYYLVVRGEKTYKGKVVIE